ncbi:MAG: LacI family DNA-binding transcriptional regulator [Phycisphaerales bacterium]|jgi:DNA-binding LacI/PurR family transcriptional regulator|nr:LacI family DNA-binding transcriptional regulator [Phycisphaerales bacterium]MBT7171519.1 LacI family DNA-binding transcriptional regulator [Phycisphaerales bacterium]
MITIRELARLTGYSTYLVSKALRDLPGVSEKARKKVKAVAAENGYIPNRVVQGVFRGHVPMVALVVPHLGADPMSKLAQSICRHLAQRDLACAVFDSKGSPEEMYDAFRRAVSFRVAGMILHVGEPETSTKMFNELKERNIPFILLSERNAPYSVTRVHGDDQPPAEALVKNLLELGHKRFGIIAAHKYDLDKIVRIQAYRDIIARAGAELPAEAFITDCSGAEGGEEGMRRLLTLTNRPTAVLTTHDPIAAGAIRYARKVGLHVPGDISIAGYSDTDMASLLDPPLTTVTHNSFEHGRLAVETLCQMMEKTQAGETVAPKDVVCHREPVFRASTGPAPK